jgi:hypothetical protein
MRRTKHLIMAVIGILVVFGIAVNDVHGEDSTSGNLTEGDDSLDAEQMKTVEYNYFFGLDPANHKVIATHGKLPELETEEQKQNWSYNIGGLIESLKIELSSSYMHPNGKVMTCGSNSRGYFVILFYENLTKTDPLIDKIYTMIDEKAKNRGIQEVPVEFGYGFYYYEYEIDNNLREPERTSLEEFMRSGRGIYNPRVIATYGTPPEFENREQWRNWADEDKYHVIIEGLNYQHQQGIIDSYFYPAGPVIGYGIAINDYITVTIYENLTVEKPLLDEIYAIIDEEAKKNGIHEVPVMFIKEGLIIADDGLLVEDSNNETPPLDETSGESVPGFKLLGGLIAFFGGWLFMRKQA